jgi:hypothetical protein
MIKTVLNTLQITWIAAGVLARDRLLGLLAILSALAFTAAIGLAGLVLYAGKAIERISGGDIRLLDLIFLFGGYLLICFAGLYFNVALTAAARDRLEKAFTGLEPALDAVNSRLGAIFAWAAFAGTAGFFIKRLGRNAKPSGLFVGTWNSSLVVPVMIAEAETPVSSMGRTEELFARVWGARSVPNFNFVIVYAYLAVVVLAAGAGLNFLTGSEVFGAEAALCLFLFGVPIIRSMEALLAVDLYYYAASGASGFFPEGLLRKAYVARSERGRWKQGNVPAYEAWPSSQI